MDRTTYQREWARKKFGFSPRIILSHDDVRSIIVLVDEGLRQRSIAVAFGISQSEVSKLARSRGVE